MPTPIVKSGNMPGVPTNSPNRSPRLSSMSTITNEIATVIVVKTGYRENTNVNTYPFHLLPKQIISILPGPMKLTSTSPKMTRLCIWQWMLESVPRQQTTNNGWWAILHVRQRTAEGNRRYIVWRQNITAFPAVLAMLWHVSYALLVSWYYCYED